MDGLSDASKRVLSYPRAGDGRVPLSLACGDRKGKGGRGGGVLLFGSARPSLVFTLQLTVTHCLHTVVVPRSLTSTIWASAGHDGRVVFVLSAPWSCEDVGSVSAHVRGMLMVTTCGVAVVPTSKIQRSNDPTRSASCNTAPTRDHGPNSAHVWGPHTGPPPQTSFFPTVVLVPIIYAIQASPF